MVCERLSASGGTEMMGWAEYSGSALRGRARNRAPGVERRQVFRGRVVNDVGVREPGLRRDVRLQGEQARSHPDHGEHENVTGPGLEEAGPGKSAFDEHVGPEGGCRLLNADC